MLNVETQQSTVVTSDGSAKEVVWIDDETIVFLQSEDDGTTSIGVGNPENFENSKQIAGNIPGPVENLKVKDLGEGWYGVAVSGKAQPDDTLLNPQKVEHPYSSGRLYNSGFVRHWDTWTDQNRNAIFLTKLHKKEDGTFELNQAGIKNALAGTKLSSPIEPFGGVDHFDIGVYGLVFTSKDATLNPATHTKTNIHVVAKRGFWHNLFYEEFPEIKTVTIDGFEGACTSPVWSNSGKMIAFLAMKTDGYESDKNQPFIIHDYTNPSELTPIFASKDGKGKWDRSPQSITWSKDDWHLYFLAEEHGRGCLFSAGPPTAKDADSPLPSLLVKGGTIGAATVLSNGDLFLTSTSLIENSLYSAVPLSARKGRNDTYTLPIDDRPFDANPDSLTTKYVSSSSRSGSMFGLSRAQVDEIHFPGAAKDTSVHAWVIKPSNFSSKKTYPLAYLIHGGPQGAWTDGWSTRWNPAVFAEQGYVVICPNPTGSTSYGQDFCDAIRGQWGGLPYEDIALGFDWIKENLNYVDTDRAVALGASYGGYMMNWVQGHELGRKFKALVTHDGIFSMAGQMASEELYFPFHDLTGKPWDKPEEWAQWDPSRFTENWDTPHLIVHSELDYRLTVSEGLAAFNVLQTRGVESQFLTFPDENHWVLKPENGLMWHEVVLDWINKHVGLEKYTKGREKQGLEMGEKTLAIR
ncbi:hypothetical protein SNOG_04375 [Parastagonospora nodorum SN15]|nr:hypothetical protein SNOG_04375 [Parastagonospora nodorum SN15]EAT88135.2 hypothetical protein SNOG_04375 [Parastagonospora nodorum SN15]